MSKLILEHAQKEQIDTILRGQGSYRDKAAKIAKDLQFAISYKTLQQYHTKYLGAALDLPNELDLDLDNQDNQPTPLDIDTKSIQTLVDKLQSTNTNMDTLECLKDEISELFAIQLLLTKNALNRHIQGLCRNPDNYIRNLQIFYNMLHKSSPTKD